MNYTMNRRSMENTTAKPKYARTMKARRNSQCPCCGRMIGIGDRITETRIGWIHLACKLDLLNLYVPAAMRGD